MEGLNGVAVDGDVVWVAVAAVRLEGDNDLRPDAADDADQAAGTTPWAGAFTRSPWVGAFSGAPAIPESR